MTRNAKPIRPNQAYGGPGRVLGDEAPTEVYPLRHGGRAVPDRTREPDIGAACHETRKVSPPVSNTEELRSGVPTGSPVENTKTRQDYGNRVTESRHGQQTMPGRPGRGWIE
jgi:hypothetical protein